VVLLLKGGGKSGMGSLGVEEKGGKEERGLILNTGRRI